MAKITADQIHALYGEFDDKGNKKLKLGEASSYRKLQKADIQNMSDQELMELFLQHSTLQDKFSDELVKDEIKNLFADPGQISELRRMLIENRGDVEHIITGYKKLAKVKKAEKEIEKLEKQINDIKLRLYMDKNSLQNANRVVIAKVQRIQKQIDEKKAEKEKLLQTKEVVAAYELQKITGYADRLNQGKLVYTPSVEKNKEEVRNSVFTGQNILLTGPVGTGKTRLAIDIYKEILEEKKKNGEIDDQVYQKLSQLCVVNGNEDTSIRELKSRPVQMSNKEGEENVFTYDEGLLTLCLKYGMPLIIDEANRTSPNFLSSLKKFWALKPGQEYKDEVTGETFKIKSPLQVILTSNEGQKYGKHTTEFQDQIERELERVYVGYMPENELYDLAKAKLYETPGIANVTERDLQETLPHLINAVTEINGLYTSGKEYSSAESTSDWKLSSTVLDTKRFLQLIDREKIGTGETFRDELNQKIVEFIQGIKPSDAGDMDRKILCSIFHKNGLLCKENISDLVKGADKLTAHDLSTLVSSSKSQLKIPTGTRFVNPWQFAKGYGNLTNREGDVARHRLANFEDLDFEDSGTKLKTIAKSLRGLGVLNVMDDGEIISKLNKLDENNLESVLNDVADVVLSKDQSKIREFGKVLIDADDIIPGISDKIFDKLGNANFEESVSEESVFEDISNEAEISGEIPQDLKDFREKWEKEIDLSDDKKKAIIDAVNKIPHRATIESDGSRLVEFELGGKTYKSLDVNLEKHSDANYLTSYNYNWQTNNEVKLGGMRGDDTSKRKNRTLAEYVEKEKKGREMDIPTIEFQRELVDRLGEAAGLTEMEDKIAMWMYLTGNYGYYWLTMGDSKSSGSQVSRSLLYCFDDYRGFSCNSVDDSDASLCLIACK